MINVNPTNWIFNQSGRRLKEAAYSVASLSQPEEINSNFIRERQSKEIKREREKQND